MEVKKVLLFSIILILAGIFFWEEAIFATTVRFESPTEAARLEELIDALINLITVIALALVPLMILIGAYYFLSSGGDAKKLETGKKIMLWTIIGLVIVFLARGIVVMIRNFLRVS